MTTKIIFLFLSVALFYYDIFLVFGIWFRGKRNAYLRTFFAIGLIFSTWALFNGFSVLLTQDIYQMLYPYYFVLGCAITPLFLLYVLHFAESKLARSRVLVTTLVVLVTVNVLVLLTNPLHHEFIAGYDGLLPIGGRWFPVHALINYIPLLISLIVLFRYIIKNIKKTPFLLAVGFAVILPVVVNTLYTFNIFNPGFDLTPFTFLLMFVIFSIYSSSLGLFDNRNTAFMSLFNTFSDAFLIVDKKGLVTDANPSFIKAFPGLALEFDKTTVEEVVSFFESIAIEQNPADIIKRFTSPDEDIFSAEITLIVNDNPGYFVISKNNIFARRKHVGFIITLIDVSNNQRTQQMIDEIKENNLKLLELKDMAEAANKAKSAFLSTMSHEIRTPMNAILGITEIQLQNESLDKSAKEAFNKIFASGDMLLGIINDILDLSRIESGKLELTVDKYEIASLISDTAQLNILRMDFKPIEFILNVDENIPSVLSGDELRVKQILNNILSNAFKYTASGTITLSIGLLQDHGNDDNTVTLSFVISDTGCGMTKEQVDKLFDEYSRFYVEANRNTEGTGLGMSITRNLLTLMNGSISVESEPGKGSTFSVLLPQGKAGDSVLGAEMVANLGNFRTSSRAQRKREKITREPMPYGKVLIVDDVETNIYVASGLISLYEINVDSAGSGFEAIEKVRKGNEYDIIFMDHMMPQLDGVETTKFIRDLGYAKPIVALTANAVSGQAGMFLTNGFDDFISKPIDVHQLNDVLNKLIRDRHSEIVKTRPEQIDAEKNDTNPAAQPAVQQTAQPDAQPAVQPDAQPAVQPAALDNRRFAEIFTRDALKTITALNTIREKGIYEDNNDLQSYIINVHGMKSALANIGEPELSGVAGRLETLARANDIEALQSETPAFVDALSLLVETLKPDRVLANEQAEDDDSPFLYERMIMLKTACDTYDRKTAKSAVSDLSEKKWSPRVREMLDSIEQNLLHSNCVEINDIVEKYLSSAGTGG